MIAAAAGACVAIAMLVLAWPAAAVDWQPRRRRRPLVQVVDGARLVFEPRARRPLAWIRERQLRAGHPPEPWRFCGAAGAIAIGGGLAAAVMASVAGIPPLPLALGVAGVTAVGAVRSLEAAGRARCSRLLAELAPTLDLVGIELGGGSSAGAAFGAVVARTRGELSAELRAALAAAAVGGPAFDVRLAALGERLEAPPIAAVAAVLATSRDYGSGVAQGLRAISLDLRRGRRRELIAAGRRSLVRVLVPATAGVLMPFMAILLFPAVVALLGTFR